MAQQQKTSAEYPEAYGFTNPPAKAPRMSGFSINGGTTTKQNIEVNIITMSTKLNLNMFSFMVGLTFFHHGYAGIYMQP